MTEKELHKLSREDLLRLLLAQSKEVNRQKAQAAASAAECGELKATLERLKDKLNEKDEQIERLKKKLDEKDALLADYQAEGPELSQSPIVRTEGMSADMRAELTSIGQKLEALRELIESHDEENRHLWTLLDGMMDQME